MIRKFKMHIATVGIAGLLRVIVNQLTRSHSLLRVKRADCKFPFGLRLPSSDIPTCKQVFVDREYDFELQKAPNTIVDAGANIGLASIYFANQYPAAKIIALEPEESNFALLSENVAAYPNITPVHAALWHRNEEINLVDPGLGHWGFMTEQKNSTERSLGNVAHPVRAMTVDQVIEEFQLERIDILKIDIEGAEREVFSDTSAWISKVDTLIVELHEHMKAGCNRNFYNGSNGFHREWQQGENVYLSRENHAAPKRG
jgi:FkbM family methyltransferase